MPRLPRLTLKKLALRPSTTGTHLPVLVAANVLHLDDVGAEVGQERPAKTRLRSRTRMSANALICFGSWRHT